MKYIVEIDGDQLEVEIKKSGNKIKAKVEEREYEAKLLACGIKGRESQVLILKDKEGEKHIPLTIAESKEGYELGYQNSEYEVRVEKKRVHELRKHMVKKTEVSKAEKVIAHMPGLILDIKVKQGDEVKKGQGICVIDAMKMENEILAPKKGNIARLEVEEGQEIDKGHLICIIK